MNTQFDMLLLLVHALATWFMVGLIWTIQVVHYPLFRLVGEPGFVDYEQGHTARMGALLALPAFLEVVTGGLLVWLAPEGVSSGLVLVGGFLLVVMWVVTLLVNVPQHRTLSTEWSDAVIGRLVATNWIRTAGWSLRGLLVALMVSRVA